MEEDEIDIRGLFGVLRRHLKLMLAVVVVVLAGAFFYVYSMTPVYTASTLILVDPADKNLLASTEGYQNYGLNDIRVDGEIEILKSDAVAMRVVDEAGLLTDPEFGFSGEEAGTAPPTDVAAQFLLKRVIQAFKGATKVARKGQTYLISASVSSTDPVRAAELTNIYANAYIEHQIATKVESIQKVREILAARLDEARKALEDSETAFDRFISDNLAVIEEQTGRTDLTALRALLVSVDNQGAQKAEMVKALEGSLQQKDWASLAEALQDDALKELERRRAELERSLETAGAGTQVSIDIRQELANIDTALDQEANLALSGLKAELNGLRTQAGDTQAKIRETVLQGDLPPALLTKIYSLQQDANITRSQYDSFLSRLRELELQTELQVADSRVVSPALPPIYPSSQSKRQILMLAGVLAVVLAAGLAFVNEFFIGGFTSEEQLAHTLQLPVAARIPAVTPLKSPERPDAAASAAEVYAEQPMSGYAESIRRLRVAIDQSLGRRSDELRPEGSKGDVIMVTSAVPGEGKSNTALALGRTYAGSGLRTLLIDCDLRKPRVHRILGQEPNSGMLHYLMNEGQDSDSDFEEMYQRDYASSLEILLGAGRSNVPTDQLLVGPRFSHLIAGSREVFDVIILDTPPLLPLVDGLYLAHHADVIALVVKWASTTQQDVKSILPALFESKNKDADVLAVLSQERSGKLGYYRKYAAYYGYAVET